MESCQRCGRTLTLADPNTPLTLCAPYTALCHTCWSWYWQQWEETHPHVPPAPDPLDEVAP